MGEEGGEHAAVESLWPIGARVTIQTIFDEVRG
jgi:hypothetical protein